LVSQGFTAKQASEREEGEGSLRERRKRKRERGVRGERREEGRCGHECTGRNNFRGSSLESRGSPQRPERKKKRERRERSEKRGRRGKRGKERHTLTSRSYSIGITFVARASSFAGGHGEGKARAGPQAGTSVVTDVVAVSVVEVARVDH
jgi:hypothetical protein